MFEEVRNFFKEKKVTKIATVSVVAPATTFALSIPAFAAEGSTGLETYKNVIDSIADTLSTTNLSNVLVYAVGVAIGLVFLWWGVRKVSRILMSAFRKGRLRL